MIIICFLIQKPILVFFCKIFTLVQGPLSPSDGHSLSPCPHLHCHHYPAPLSPDSKRRLAELSHDLSLAQKISLGSMWLLAAFYGMTACFPEKVRLSTLNPDKSLGLVHIVIQPFQIFGNEMITDIEKEVGEELVMMEQRMVGGEVTVCSIRTGVDDFLDFMGVTITLVIPTLLGTQL